MNEVDYLPYLAGIFAFFWIISVILQFFVFKDFPKFFPDLDGSLKTKYGEGIRFQFVTGLFLILGKFSDCSNLYFKRISRLLQICTWMMILVFIPYAIIILRAAISKQ